MTVESKLITANELLAMGDIGRCELVYGEIVFMAPASAEHGGVAAELLYRIKAYVDEKRLGKVFAAETGFTIARNPDLTLAPDVAFVQTSRLPPQKVSGFYDGPPDLAVEVLSPSDRPSAVTAKIIRWLDAGAVSVWIVDPSKRSVDVHSAKVALSKFGINDVLADEPTLPGFFLKIRDVFDAS